jgi:adenosylcobinamide amidohydrolase
MATGPDGLPTLVWEPGAGWRAISSAVLGGGIGPLSWLVNAQVPDGYRRMDPDRHLAAIAAGLGLAPPGVGLLTAARVADVEVVRDSGVVVAATVGIGRPTWAAAGPTVSPAVGLAAGPAAGPAAGERESAAGYRPGTINILVCVPVPLEDSALVGAVITATEAKVQGLLDASVGCSGTASDAICVAAPDPAGALGAGRSAEAFAGPRSHWGSPIGRAVHAAVHAGVRRWFASPRSPPFHGDG